MEVSKPKTIEEAIDDLQEFLECDLYTKFRPGKNIKGEMWYREDPFLNENEFHKYIDGHFDVLKEQVRNLSNKSSEVKNGN